MHVCTYICIYVYIYMSVRSPSPNTAFFLASGGRVCRASTSPPWKDPTRLSCQGGLVDPDSLDYLMRDNISCLVMVSARTTPRMPRPPRPSRRIGRGGGRGSWAATCSASTRSSRRWIGSSNAAASGNFDRGRRAVEPLAAFHVPRQLIEGMATAALSGSSDRMSCRRS